MSVDDRWTVVKKMGVRFQCLGLHNYRSCTSNICPTYNRPHHSSLHRYDSRFQISIFATSYQPSQSSDIQLPRLSDKGLPHHNEQHYVNNRGCCYSSTTLVAAVNSQYTCLVRLLIDGGSDSFYILS